jgi:hypothetical protein
MAGAVIAAFCGWSRGQLTMLSIVPFWDTLVMAKLSAQMFVFPFARFEQPSNKERIWQDLTFEPYWQEAEDFRIVE